MQWIWETFHVMCQFMPKYCLFCLWGQVKGHTIKLTAPINLHLAGLLLHSDRLRLTVCLGLLLKDKVSTCEVPALMEGFKPIRYTERSCCDKSRILPHGLVLPPSHDIKLFSISTRLVIPRSITWVMSRCGVITSTATSHLTWQSLFLHLVALCSWFWRQIKMKK